jgi:site-specific recombinase XerD
VLTLYRRHNPARCSSRDSQNCSNKRRPCPILIRGSKPDGTYIREPLKSRDWTKALDILREIEATGQRPAPPTRSQVTVEEWRDQFIKNARTENVSEETIRKYTLLFKQLLAFTQDRGIRFPGRLDLESLQEFRNTWRDAPLSKSKKQERLRSIFRFAVARKWISENPALQLGRIKVDRTQQTPFGAEEMAAILKAAIKAGPEVYTFILTMRFSGLRISDVAMLRAASLQGNHLVLRTDKTGTPVKVLLPNVVADALRKIERKNSDYFFWNGRSKLTSVTDLWRSHRIRPVFEKAKIKNAHPHRFRHTFAVELLKQGTPAGTVAILLGNTEQIVIKHYSAWIEARQKGLDEAVEKANGYHDILPVGA